MNKQELIDQYSISLQQVSYHRPHFIYIHREIWEGRFTQPINPIHFYIDIRELDKLKDGMIAVVLYRSEGSNGRWSTEVYRDRENIGLCIQDCLANPTDSEVIWRVFERVEDPKTASAFTQGRVYLIQPALTHLPT